MYLQIVFLKPLQVILPPNAFQLSPKNKKKKKGV